MPKMLLLLYALVVSYILCAAFQWLLVDELGAKSVDKHYANELKFEHELSYNSATINILETIDSMNSNINRLEENIDKLNKQSDYAGDLMTQPTKTVIEGLKNNENNIPCIVSEKGLREEDIIVANPTAKKVRVTSYCKEYKYNLTASGKNCCPAYVAVSRDLHRSIRFGSKIILYIKLSDGLYYRYGDCLFVEDLTHPRIKNTVDVFIEDCKKSIEFGVKKGLLIVQN